MYVPGMRQVVFENRQEDFQELETTAFNRVVVSRSYMDGVGPYGELTSGFRNLLESGTMVKFVVSESRGIFIGSTRVSHAYIASFQGVLTAGYVKCVGIDKVEPADELVNEDKSCINCTNFGWIRRIRRSKNNNKKDRDYDSLRNKITFNLEINNQTGHYRTTTSSLGEAVSRFRSIGYNVSVVTDWKTGKPVDLS
ncbi:MULTISPECIES: hypothetical protein [Candidatus Ichthyocystis]|uniref:Uncharacterized protein n=1 Tax=Candidatus Ichthyocystis hellenicum TaxID=1561003 RepID=A0A0S4M8B0_9BURK|nr:MULTISPECIES: hypothetical protein [Ichthyocystis]CUT18392.1 hypothetical protein Ark11_1601 [Candidatus Ichthyocystis hellenicum]